MRSIATHFRSYLRAAALALLVLGLMVQPILIGVGQVHEVEHAVFGGASHDHELTNDHHDGGAPDGDPSHATGSHSLMHHHAVVVVADVPWNAPLPRAQASDAGEFAFPECAVSAGSRAGPFRPPIA
jgi:hypothetical protein